MTALLKKGTGNADWISISGKDALSYSFQIYGFEGDDILKGGKKNDFLSGGNGNDSLYSGVGNDVLFGGRGEDTFIFNAALGNSSIIRDFNPAEDKIQLDMSVFSKLSSGVLNRANFVNGRIANDVNDYLIYNSGTGVLSYDEDGSGANSSNVLAQLSPNLSLTNANFLVTLPAAMKDTLNALGTLPANQGNFSVTSEQIYTKDSLISVAADAMSVVFSSLFGEAVTISQLNITTYDGNTAVSGLLSNGQRLTIILGNATAIDYAISGGMDLGTLTGLDFLKGMGLNSAQFVLSSEGVTINNPTLGWIDVGRGASIIGTIDLSTSNNQAFKFISDYLGIDTLVGYLSLDPEDGVALTGEVNTDITFIRTGAFSITETQMALSAGVGVDLVPSVGISNTLEITGYDPTQSNEPTLALTGGISFDPKSVTISANLDAESAWQNPFGFQGAIIRNLGFQVGATYITPWLDNIGFVSNLTWGNYDIDFAASIGITDPEKVAFTFTLNKEISAIQLFAQMNSMAMGPAASTLINYASPLFNYIPFTIVSIDSDNNGALNPLVSFVPFPASIGSYSLTQGMGIAGQVKFFGATGTMALQVNSTFTDMTGSLTINNLDLGWLTISGTQSGTDLTGSFEISAAHQYLKGDGKITMFGQTLAQAHFEFSPTSISISNTQFGIGNILAFRINYLNASLASQSASGNADVVIFGYSVAGMNFSMDRSHLSFHGYIDLSVMSIDANFDWNFAQNSLAASGTMQINHVSIAHTTITYNGNDGLILSGDLGINVSGFGSVGVAVSTTVKNGTVADISIDASLGALGHVGFSVNPSQFNVDALATTLANKTATNIGELSEWAADAVNKGLTSAYNEVAHVFTSNEVTNTLKNVGNTIKGWFTSTETNQRRVDLLNVDDNWGMNGGNDVVFCNGGNDASNGHQGNDLMDGGSGSDTLYGGSNNDKIDGGLDNDYLYGQEGFDTLYGGFGDDFMCGATFPDSTMVGDDDVLHGGFGNDSLYGANGIDILYGDGGNDTLYGNPTANKLADGYVDTLWGGLGDDVYYYTEGIDFIGENWNEGNDSVYSTVSHGLQVYFENLYLQGSSNINGDGNDLNNVVHGNDAANLLNGLGGADYLNGGAGNDTLAGSFGADTLVGGTGVDTFQLLDMNRFIISDFSVIDDSIKLNTSVFTRLTTQPTLIPSIFGKKLSASNFVINASALDNNDYLIYNKATGELSYDADANGSAAPTPIALLSANLALTNADFYIS